MIVGVDPGHWGGIAFLDGDGLEVFAMPAASGHDYDINEIIAMLGASRASHKKDLLVIERVTRPASLTRCQGLFEGVGEALGYRVETVRPQAWKAAMGLTGEDKRASMELARQRFPDMAEEFKRITRDDGKAEAALIALFARETML